VHRFITGRFTRSNSRNLREKLGTAAHGRVAAGVDLAKRHIETPFIRSTRVIPTPAELPDERQAMSMKMPASWMAI